MALLGAVFLHDSWAQSQTATTLSQVRKIYVEQFTGKRGAAQIRDEVVERLKHQPALTVVSNASQADAVLKGNGEIWTTGHISTNPRTSGGGRNPIYTGYLSLTLEGGNGQALWSYMVLPAGALSGTITSGLAVHGTRLLLAAVVRDKESGAARSTAASPNATAQPAAEVALKGAGSTFTTPLYKAWLQSFEQLHPKNKINYDPIGSEQGSQRLLDGQIDFAASDLPVFPAGANLQRFATVLGAVVPIYNIAGTSRELHFTPEILAGIYLGKITRWNDSAIRAANRGLSLPDASIAVVHRSDGSGTTYAFTDFLTKTSAAWRSAAGSGSTVIWPTGTGIVGNDGVATMVQSTPNSIGYVELTYAVQHELSFGAVRNAAGAFITANLNSVAAAADSATGDASLSITNAAGKMAYPISSFTWIVLPVPVPAGDRAAIAEMLQWMLTSGQKQSSALGYAPLPHGIAVRELQMLTQLK